MQMGFKAIVLVMTSLASTQIVAANDSIDREHMQIIGQAFATGFIDAEIQASCFIQHTDDNRDYVANKAECRESLRELESVLSDDERLADQRDRVKRFRKQYGI